MKKIALILLIASNSGCNIFHFLDKPATDEQLISAARACFDRGDIECALDYYQQVSADNVDIQKSEEAFATLNDQGVNMKTFIAAMGSGGGAVPLTTLANTMIYNSGESRRIAMWNAFQSSLSINSKELRGLVRLITSIALISEMLAESSGPSENGEPRKFNKDDIVNTPNSCKDITDSGCVETVNSVSTGNDATACKDPGDRMDNGTTDIDLESTKPTGTRPTIRMLINGLEQISKALDEELAASGKFKVGAGNFSDTIRGLSLEISGTTLSLDDLKTENPQCIRQALINAGIGDES